MFEGNVVEFKPKIRNIPWAMSDVFFNMETTGYNDCSNDPPDTIFENAQMLISMLEEVNANFIPSVEELFIDFQRRV